VQVPDGCVPLWIDVEDVTDPPLGVPTVLTLTGPELKNVAGPNLAFSDGAMAVNGLANPPCGSVTTGVGPKGGWELPKIVTLGAHTPKALPVTEESPVAVAATAPVSSAADANAAPSATHRNTLPRDLSIPGALRHPRISKRLFQPAEWDSAGLLRLICMSIPRRCWRLVT
jgi:hypothetical protein